MNFTITPRTFYPPGKDPLHPLNRKLGWLQSRSAGDRTHDSSAVQPTAQSPHRLHHSGFVPITSLLNPAHTFYSIPLKSSVTLSSNLCLHFFSTRAHHVPSPLLIISGESSNFKAIHYATFSCLKLLLPPYVLKLFSENK